MEFEFFKTLKDFYKKSLVQFYESFFKNDTNFPGTTIFDSFEAYLIVSNPFFKTLSVFLLSWLYLVAPSNGKM